MPPGGRSRLSASGVGRTLRLLTTGIPALPAARQLIVHGYGDPAGRERVAWLRLIRLLAK